MNLTGGRASAGRVAKYGRHLKLIDDPNERSSHRLATSKGGAIGILAAFMAVIIIVKMPAAFWMPASFLLLISLLSDRFDIAPVVRLLFNFSGSIIFFNGQFFRAVCRFVHHYYHGNFFKYRR